MVFDTIFDSGLEIKRIIGVSWVVRSDWHDRLLAVGVVPVERVVGAITEHPDRCFDGKRAMYDAYRRLFGHLFTLGDPCGDRNRWPG